MKSLRSLFIPVLFLTGLASCTEVIEVETLFATPELVVDAWLDQRDAVQTIRLSWSQDYFDSVQPAGVTEASVLVRNETTGQTFEFPHSGQGIYQWTPGPGRQLGAVGDVFRLEVRCQDQVYEARSTMNAVPPIDSIVYEYREEAPEINQPAGYYAQLYARDLPGTGNAYWIKTYKNGHFLNKPAEMNLSYDGAVNVGSGADGITFIPLVREAINRLPDPDTADEDMPPYAIGDEIRVEIHAITYEAHRFLSIAQEQMTNGDNNIFALPFANAPGNVTAVGPEAPAALGFFSVANVSVLEITLEE